MGDGDIRISPVQFSRKEQNEKKKILGGMGL